MRSLFRGIKKLWRIKRKTQKEGVYDFLLDFIEGFEANDLDQFRPIYDTIDALRSTRDGLSRATIQSITESKPSGFALDVTAEVFNLSERTVQRYLKLFTSEVRDEIFQYLTYSNLFLEKKEQPTYFKFLTSMIAEKEKN